MSMAGELRGVEWRARHGLLNVIVSRCTELASGGRMIDAILTNMVLPRISEEFLIRMMEGKAVWRGCISGLRMASLGMSLNKSRQTWRNTTLRYSAHVGCLSPWFIEFQIPRLK